MTTPNSRIAPSGQAVRPAFRLALGSPRRMQGRASRQSLDFIQGDEVLEIIDEPLDINEQAEKEVRLPKKEDHLNNL